MKFTKTWKRFWTLNRHHAAGFTLVELIVVIAILAILAGIAIPAYSGYINKAKKAGDYTLLSAVNTAFAAACIENGTSAVGQKATIDGYQNGSAADITVSCGNEKIASSFAIYMGENVKTNFEVISSLVFDTSKGVFVDPESLEGTLTGSYAGGTVVLNGAALNALKGSTFLNAATLGGSAGLLDKIDEVTDMAAGMADSLNAVFNDPSFAATAMAALGVTTPEEYYAKQDQLIGELMANNEGMTREEAVNTLSANAAVLYASQNAANMTKEDLNGLFTDGGINTVKNNLKGEDTALGMGQAALIYGMYTAYANSSEYGSAELQANTGDAMSVLNALEKDPNFKTYINSEQGQTDMDAYLGALGMINDSAASSPDAVEHLMVNGFNNDELKELIGSATGK